MTVLASLGCQGEDTSAREIATGHFAGEDGQVAAEWTLVVKSYELQGGAVSDNFAFEPLPAAVTREFRSEATSRGISVQPTTPTLTEAGLFRGVVGFAKKSHLGNGVTVEAYVDGLDMPVPMHVEDLGEFAPGLAVVYSVLPSKPAELSFTCAAIIDGDRAVVAVQVAQGKSPERCPVTEGVSTESSRRVAQ